MRATFDGDMFRAVESIGTMNNYLGLRLTTIPGTRGFPVSVLPPKLNHRRNLRLSVVEVADWIEEGLQIANRMHDTQFPIVYAEIIQNDDPDRSTYVKLVKRIVMTADAN